ncbi:hypothetical protein CLV84_0796 [Neolewinella xylanilytica]|uniref:DUF4374 domain-containing protein n=1 Tax=Neolewinella xylanilytica TaxID=1514080 RepID=A0A2S6I8M9_9BACT|nr:hypothetical protein [Neolewinella xylanilytica]PPK87843.1 hypothetical protein CLV84_0796 [Neolewinella xylanilytica]
MTTAFNRFATRLLVFGLIGVLPLTSCEEDETPTPTTGEEETPGSEDREYFTLALSASPTGETKVYTQALTDVSEGTVSYDGVGYEIPSTRTARIFSSADGSTLYNLDYGGGRIYKFDVNGGEDYALEYEKNVEFVMGTAYPRWSKANEATASVHYAEGSEAARVYEYTDSTEQADGTYVYTDSTFVRSDVTVRVMTVGLDALTFGAVEEFVIPVTPTDLESYNYVGRVDAPVIAGDKIFYGMAKSAYNPVEPCTGRGCPAAVYTNTETLVLDYPGLTNPRIIATEMAAGATNGYRTPVAHLDEEGDVYQIISVPDNTYDTYILRIRDGEYDESFDFNLSDLLGENTRAYGWFYTGNGIGYVPYLRTDETDSNDDSNWSVARVDLYQGTAVKMNLPENLWLRQYQNAAVRDNNFYMAITPTGEDGNVYIFDTTSDSPDGFTLGATLKNLAEGTYIGIY